MNYFNYNGKLYQVGTPVIGADNRGLRYGDGLFETIRMIEGQLIFEDEHFARLWRGLKVLQFELPKQFTTEMLVHQIAQLVHKNRHEKGGRIRLSIVRGDGGLYDAKNHSPNYIIQSWALPEGNGEWNSNGLVLGIYDAVKKSCDLLANLKHNNYLPYVLGALHAKREKWNDAILLNSHGRVCDSTIANIFIVKDQIIYTPSLSEGCVAGVMRKVIIQQLSKENVEVREQGITLAELLSADEVFLTNSLYNIRWVQRIGDSSYKSDSTQKILASLQQTIL